jgi:hypothetical protein
LYAASRSPHPDTINQREEIRQRYLQDSCYDGNTRDALIQGVVDGQDEWSRITAESRWFRGIEL